MGTVAAKKTNKNIPVRVHTFFLKKLLVPKLLSREWRYPILLVCVCVCVCVCLCMHVCVYVCVCSNTYNPKFLHICGNLLFIFLLNSLYSHVALISSLNGNAFTVQTFCKKESIPVGCVEPAFLRSGSAQSSWRQASPWMQTSPRGRPPWMLVMWTVMHAGKPIPHCEQNDTQV